MRIRYWAALVAAIFISATANAELNTVQYISFDGAGEGRLDIDGNGGQLLNAGDGPVSVDLSGASTFTVLDGEGGDMWNGGDQFTYLYDSSKVTGDFTATVRVVSQTESVEGRWGKVNVTAQANLSGFGQQASAQVYSGTGSQVDPPAAGDHSPIPVRIGGRTGTDGNGGFELPISNAAGEIPNNVFPEPDANVINPTTNVSWLRLQYQAESNSFLAGYAEDVNGAPGAWGYSDLITNVPEPTAEDGEGWYVGIGYSAHNSLQVAELEDSDRLHGIGFDNYSIVNEFLPQELAVGGVEIGSLTVAGESSGLAFGEPTVVSGLSQFWFSGNLRPGNGEASGPEEYIAVGTTGTEEHPLINPTGRAIVTDTTWWRGPQANPVTNADIPSYPAEIEGSPGFTGDNYGVKLIGEIFIPEDGEYIIRDGIDDFTMIAIDADGDGVLEFADELITADVGTIAGNSLGDVHVLDDDWANADGTDQAPEFHGYADIEGIGPEGDWRAIEIWMGEGGGGDAGIVYFGNADDPDIFTENDDSLTPEQRDAYLIKQEDLRTTVTPVIGGTSAATLDDGVQYIVQATADGADQIVVDDGNGSLVTSLDVSGATIVINDDGLAEGTSISLFDADSITGTDSLNLVFSDPSQWDLSNISEGVITFGPGGGVVCDATTGGDINGDGSVGFPDFLILSANFGSDVSGAGHLEGDIDCSGDVAFADFLVLSNAFGTTVGAEASSVPEPSGLALLGLAGMFAGMFRRRR